MNQSRVNMREGSSRQRWRSREITVFIRPLDNIQMRMGGVPWRADGGFRVEHAIRAFCPEATVFRRRDLDASALPHHGCGSTRAR
jgi:hypothetical protein